MASEEKVYKLQTEVAVINSKLDDISQSLKSLTEWTARHEAEHAKLSDDHESIRVELRRDASVIGSRVNSLEREYVAFASRQNIINAMLGFLAGTAVTVVATILFGGISL
jgi:predicted  nucleic acid-binding Zn-ribbon protein